MGQHIPSKSAVLLNNDPPVLMAYPNPAKDIIMLKANDPSIKIKNISFYSIIGVKAMELTVNQTYVEARLDRLQPGKYLVRYTLSDNTQSVKQIIKQ
ncbi:Por secretion system C-terminal sorting domain-containing protein [Riemerella columbipharyngis]|uniref:Por secretion system C-terminal sorting domain-containing protein n=2 Tax=Riemerella columbipharyngis TaxID=1071918 RepID=A0A1G6YKX4_9FLAO|nr:Por secretion system C-terminal sorting domain-containing protein [Riemerella columbipharyngis]